MDIEKQVKARGRELLAKLNKDDRSVLDPQKYIDMLLNWSMESEDIKLSLFRFVDVFPTLPNSQSIVQHIREYFSGLDDELPKLFNLALNASTSGISDFAVGSLAKKQLRFFADRFIVGENEERALPKLKKIRDNGAAFTVDLLGELTVSENESIEYQQRYLKLLDALHQEVPTWSSRLPLIPGHIGEKTPMNISVKLSALYSQTSALNYKRSVKILTERLREIYKKAVEYNAFVYVDMEDASLVDITLDVVKGLIGSDEFKSYPHFGIVLQAYLRRTEKDLYDMINFCTVNKRQLGVRLVKGAYWDMETIVSRQKGWEIPVWQKKPSSDANYEKLSRILLDNHNTVTPAFASHNIRSLAHAIVYAEQKNIPKANFEIQTLYGMGTPIRDLFKNEGYLVREYCPIGDLLIGMGYLVRRLLENTSNEGFVRKTMHEDHSFDELLSEPLINEPERVLIEQISPEGFKNEHAIDFSIKEEREKIQAQIDKILESPPQFYHPRYDNFKFEKLESLESRLPEDPAKILGHVSYADREVVDKILTQMSKHTDSWKLTPVQHRSDILKKVAQIFRDKRYYLIALIVLETGKPWAEADGDVAEAIDFLEYYSIDALNLFQPKELINIPGEKNRFFYEGRGISAVLGPWNFPLAIPCGMFAASVVTGNCTILKPAEQSSIIAYEIYQAFIEAGTPKEVIAFTPGYGEIIGEYLVRDKRVSNVIFTGSKNVGLHILRSTTELSEEHEDVKRVIAEMGGKNALIIDEDADLDEAIKGVLYSGFAYAGQKCSALSRLIIVGDIYDRFTKRLCDALQSIIVGPSSKASTLVGPVIDGDAQKRILKLIESAKNNYQVVSNETYKGPGYFVPPTIIFDVELDDPIWKEEIFGPVVAVSRAKSFEEAIKIANNSKYALTGGIFSRSPMNIQKAMNDFKVGNLYINRPITGSIVLRQPFGGFKLSGIGSKAGGPGYLTQFAVPRVITENTMRRGFSPDL